MDLEIYIDIENCRRLLGALEDVSHEVVAVYRRMSESLSSYAPSWSGEDRDEFAGRIASFGEIADGIRRDLERSMDKMKNCIDRAERIEALFD